MRLAARLVCLIISWGLLAGNLCAARIYVDCSVAASGMGDSWASAKRTLTEGVAACSAGDEVWVAEGNYDEMVVVTSGLTLNGGFNKTESSPSDRDLSNHASVLNAETEYGGVVQGCALALADVENVTIDGFVLTGNKYNQASNYPTAIDVENSQNVVIRNCIFRANERSLCFIQADAFVSSCLFHDNSGRFSCLESSASDLRVEDCVVHSNDTSGFWIDDSITSISRCRFYKNAASGIRIYWKSSALIDDCEFTQNDCSETFYYDSGGGIRSEGGEYTLRNTIISGNKGIYGGGIYNGWSGDTILHAENCLLVGNTATEGGGAVGMRKHYPVSAERQLSFTNCIFSGNQAPGGSALYAEGAHMTANSCTIADNSTTGLILNSAVESTSYYSEHTLPWPLDLPANLTLRNNCITGNVPAGVGMWGPGERTVAGNLGFDQTENWLWYEPWEDENFVGDPRYVGGSTSRWADVAVYSLETNRTTIHSNLIFEDGSLNRKIINPDTSQPLQAVIDTNSGSEIVLIGDYTHLAGPGKKFRIYDYHLRRDSAAIDRGSAVDAPLKDFDSRSRPFDIPGLGAERTGTEFDIGAYERYAYSEAARWQGYE